MQKLKADYVDTRAWEKGFKAAKEGKPLNNCPHSIGSIQASSWYQGHAAALRKQKDH